MLIGIVLMFDPLSSGFWGLCVLAVGFIWITGRVGWWIVRFSPTGSRSCAVSSVPLRPPQTRLGYRT
jgi:hypothetical protein